MFGIITRNMHTAKTHQPANDSSQFDVNPAGALLGLAWAGTLSLLLIGAATPAAEADNNGPKTFIPKIANIAGFKVGYSSMEELEGQLGKGKVTVGGHPNGARLWRVKATSWVVQADAFEYSERGAVVDRLTITVDPHAGQDLPYARLSSNELAYAGGISLDLDEDHLLELLKQNSWTPTKVADGWLVEAHGHSPLTSSIYPFNRWEVTFTMKGKSLVGITLAAREKETK